MKRIMMTSFVLAAACVLCACGAAKPEETVDKYCEAMQECNYEELSQYVAHDATRDKEESSNESSGEADSEASSSDTTDETDYGSVFWDSFKDTFAENNQKMTYEIGESKIDGNRATVSATFNYLNAGPIAKAALSDLVAQSYQQILAGNEYGNEDFFAYFIGAYNKEKEAIATIPKKETIKIKCLKVNGKWYISDESTDALGNVLTSNIYKAFLDYQKNSSADDSSEGTSEAETSEQASESDPSTEASSEPSAAADEAASAETEGVTDEVTDDDYILYGSDSGYVDKSYCEELSDEDLRLARNEILARHGRTFKDQALQDYFSSKSWYMPTYTPEDFDAQQDSILNHWELANIETIKEVEAERK